ncbi:hypothetical protein D9611_014257 [Ephemerocybe angulata]|uniref:Uncharacterized protein n=1 Tax=Ephemerocybe angulata TaxID=980116 RepID=A0A8H5BST4_9AGAR|nr:hypothetical protein D9611_014257 [Tulosesus angulatus]
MPLDPSVRFSTMSRSSTVLNRPQNAPLGPRTSRSLGKNYRASNIPSLARTLSTSPLAAQPNFGAPNLYLPEFGGLQSPPLLEEPVLTPVSEADSRASFLNQSPQSFAPSLEPVPVSDQDTRDEPLTDDPPEVPTEPAAAPPEEEQQVPVEEAPSSSVPPALEDVEEEQEVTAPAYTPNGDISPPPSALTPEEPTTFTIKTPSSITLSLPSAAPSAAPSRTPSSSVKPIGPPPKLTPPPQLRFDVEPVQWKGLTMDAALWTFDSKELQSIVSRAIRSSALESFIRLLTLETLDQSLPAELKRLESAKAMSQAKYRFLVHRRTMQLQALLSSSLSPSSARDDDGMLANTKLVTQLSETVAECDQVMGELVKVTDQINQVQKLIEHHWASALAIALRKLNGSFGRRTADLKAARERIVQLEAALDEAWGEAERMAREMDDIDALSDDDPDEAIIETAEMVSRSLARTTSPSPGPDSMPLSPILLATEPHPTSGDGNENGTSSLARLSQLSPLSTGEASLSKSKASKENQTPTDIPDSVSIKSAKSTKSAKSYRSIGREVSRTASVTAARTRSNRASQSSLRLPHGVNRKQRSTSRPRTPHEKESDNELPPVPHLPLQFAPPFASMSSSQIPSANASSTLLHYDGAGNDGYYTHTRRPSLDSARGTYGHRTPLPWQVSPGMARDDMFITAARKESDSIGRSFGRESVDIQVVPRTPPRPPPKVIPMDQYAARPRPRPSVRRTGPKEGGIPSIWMNVDAPAPKTPSERVDSLMRGNSKGKAAYQRLRTLTKRYSLPFPIFASKSNGSVASSPDTEYRPSSHRSG